MVEETLVPHVGWLRHEAGDDVAVYLRQGWFEYREQAFLWLYLRPGDVVVDCGAHLGLFTLAAGRIMSDRGRVIAVEPDPETLARLRENVAGLASAEVVEGAAWSEPGTMTLHTGRGAKSAYSSLVVPVEHGGEAAVRTFTLDGLLGDMGVDRVEFLKIDVEGAELDAWRGCRRLAGSGALPVVMVEFTEANQAAAGRSTRELAEAWESAGYRWCRLDEAGLQLVPASVEGPVEYENLVAARDPDAVNTRLRDASAEHRRVAAEIVRRGAEAFGLLKRACDAEHLRDLHRREVADAHRELGECRARLAVYARFIHRVLHAPPVRLARALRLTRLPTWAGMIDQDLT